MFLKGLPLASKADIPRSKQHVLISTFFQGVYQAHSHFISNLWMKFRNNVILLT